MYKEFVYSQFSDSVTNIVHYLRTAGYDALSLGTGRLAYDIVSAARSNNNDHNVGRSTATRSRHPGGTPTGGNCAGWHAAMGLASSPGRFFLFRTDAKNRPGIDCIFFLCACAPFSPRLSEKIYGLVFVNVNSDFDPQLKQWYVRTYVLVQYSLSIMATDTRVSTTALD